MSRAACRRLGARDVLRCSRYASTSWSCTVNAGFRLLIGSWNTIAIDVPRRRRTSSKLICRTSLLFEAAPTRSRCAPAASRAAA